MPKTLFRHLRYGLGSGLLALLLVACQPISLPANAPTTTQPSTEMMNLSETEMKLVEQATLLLQEELGGQQILIQIVSVERVDWPDSSLGCPEPDMAYAQMITPGYRIVLEHNGQRYEFHSAETPDSVPILCEA